MTETNRDDRERPARRVSLAREHAETGPDAGLGGRIRWYRRDLDRGVLLAVDGREMGRAYPFQLTHGYGWEFDPAARPADDGTGAEFRRPYGRNGKPFATLAGAQDGLLRHALGQLGIEPADAGRSRAEALAVECSALRDLLAGREVDGVRLGMPGLTREWAESALALRTLMHARTVAELAADSGGNPGGSPR